MPPKLRPYQTGWLAAVEAGLARGVTRQLGRAATGLGKTVFFANLPEFLKLSKRMMVIFHREELATQAADKLRVWNPSRTVGIEMGDYRSSPSDQLIVAGVQSIGKVGSARLTQFKPEEFSALVVDECFPAGTLVDGQLIESITEGAYVLSFDPESGEHSAKKVTRVFKTPAPGRLVRVNAGTTSLAATTNHPVWVLNRKGWIQACNIQEGDYIVVNTRHTSNVCDVRGDFTFTLNVAAVERPQRDERVLRQSVSQAEVFRDDAQDQLQIRSSPNDREQPDAAPRDNRQGESLAEEDWAQAVGSRRERDGSNGNGANAVESPWLGDELRYSHEDAKEQRLPYVLQARHGRPNSEAGNRSGWQLPLCLEQTGAGQEEGSFLSYARVDSVEVLERRDSEFAGGLCGDGYVYNLEVEDYHTYFANGCLVHNCHHITAGTYTNVLKHFDVFNRKDILLFGCTATPSRADGKGLNEVFTEMVFDMPLLEGIKQGWLCDIKGFRVKTKTDISSVPTQAGDFNQQQLASTVNTAPRNELFVAEWLKSAKGRRTIAFTVDVQHAKDLAACFQKHGVRVEAVWGEDPHRAEKLAKHKSGELDVLTNCQILTEGYDDDLISCIIMAKPTQSGSLYEQMVGRGARIPADVANLVEALAAGRAVAKQDCYILDGVDITSRHTLNTMASLMGLPAQTDLGGASIVKIAAKAEEAAGRGVNLASLEDFSKIDSYIEEVDLFKVAYPAETIEISSNKWHRSMNGDYILLLSSGEDVVIGTDMLGQWSAKGVIKGNTISRQCSSFESAIQEADQIVKAVGGRSLVSIVARKASWHKREVSAAQRVLCTRLGIAIPRNATCGEVGAAITRRLAQRKITRRAA